MAEIKMVEGYTNGYKFDEFKKGETVYVFYSATAVKGSEVLREGKVVELVRAKNAKGVDCIRQVVINLGELNFMVSGPRYIKEKIYKKDEVAAVEEIAPEVPEEVTPEVETENTESETELVHFKWIEGAMTPKNKKIKKYIDLGWTFVKSVWKADKKMYVGLIIKGD